MRGAYCFLFGWLWLAAGPQTQPPDAWGPVRKLVGVWEGTTEGEPGAGTVRRSYQFVLKDRYLFEKSVSTYPPQETNKTGEIHEHWSFFSYDRIRKVIAFRQFHQEGFVNQYRLTSISDDGGLVVFESEQIENLGSDWRARETYRWESADAFVEIFEVAEPGKPFEEYSRNRFRRLR